jgi:hypothetical protein
VLRGHPHRLLLLHGSLLRDARGGGLESPPLGFLECLTRALGLLGNLCHLILQEAATGRMARGRATLGQGGGGLGVRCQGRANEGEDVGNPLGDKAGSMGSE